MKLLVTGFGLQVNKVPVAGCQFPGAFYRYSGFPNFLPGYW